MARIDLKEVSTRAPKKFDKEVTKGKLPGILGELDELQNLLYAESKHAILIVIQGMDASGKDGVISNVFGKMNPQGVSVKSFKRPTDEELHHDFLWRVHQHTPAKGMIQVFNRSHYEDVLVTRVHGMIDDDTARRRMKALNDFEQLLTEHGNTHILKFYLHVSQEKQLERLQERTTNPTKMWKYNKSDLAEAARRDDYLKCYKDVFEHCDKVPWQIVPSDQNWYKDYLVATALRDLLKSLNMAYPVLADAGA